MFEVFAQNTLKFGLVQKCTVGWLCTHTANTHLCPKTMQKRILHNRCPLILLSHKDALICLQDVCNKLLIIYL